MKIFLDQNIHEPILEWLQTRVGSDVLVASTRTLKMEREDDDVLFAFCQREGYVMVTYDQGFQNPLVVPNIPGYGVVRLNIYPTSLKNTQEALDRLLQEYPAEEWQHTSIVVDKHRIRFQKKARQ